VATPYRIGVDGWSYLLANDLLERLVHTGHANQVLSLSGRVLDIGGVRFAVIESYAVVKPPAEVNP
jgi:hypothetical protein